MKEAKKMLKKITKVTKKFRTKNWLYVAFIAVSLMELITTALVITFAVGIIDATLADAPVPPVPSFTNVTVSPTAYPSPPSTIVKSLMVESVTDATFTAA